MWGDNVRFARGGLRSTVLAVAFLMSLAVIRPAAQAQPANDDFADAEPIAGAPGTFSDSNLFATRETNEPIHHVASPLSRRSVWFQWTAPETGIATFDTIGSSFDTILAAYRHVGTNNTITNLVQIASDDDSAAGAPFFWSLIRFPVIAGTNYYIAVDGYFSLASFNFDSGPYTLNWKMGTNPVVVAPSDTVQFLSTNYTVTESGGFATIAVVYGGDGGLGGGAPVTVDYFTSDGTARDGVHYRGTNGTLTFQPGEQIQTFQVPIIDNTNLNNARTVFLQLSNVSPNALLGFPDRATLIIGEDLIEAQRSLAGSFSFSSTLYTGTEFESVSGPFAPPNPSLNNRSALGVLVTITRSAPAEGRVLIDFATTPPANSNLLAAKELIDYTPASGTLVFDDYQMSTTIMIPVFSDLTTNAFGIPGHKYFDIVLSNPRPDPLEVTNAPDKIVPTISPFFSRTTVQILDLLSRPAFNIERTSYRVSENVNAVDVDVIYPAGAGGSVRMRVIPTGPARYAFALKPASDYADGDDYSDAERTYPNTPYSDGTQPFTNPVDFSASLQYTPAQGGPTQVSRDVTITFPALPSVGALRQRVRLFITNDTMVEFNEDILLQLHDPSVPPGLGPNPTATVTILFDDQPAGAVDREWNPEGISRTQPPFYSTPGANNSVSGVAVQPDNRTVLVGDFTAVNSVSRNRIARLNQDGSIDLSFNPGTGADGHVETVLVYTNGPSVGKMLVGGDFTSINNIQRRGLARLNANGSLDTSFNPGTGADGPVRSLTVQSDGKVLVVGDFRHFNDLEVSGIMRLNPDGSLDDTFKPGLGANGSIWAVAVRDTAGTIFAPRTAFGTELEDVNRVDTGANEGTITIDYDFLSIPDNIRIYYDGVRIFDLTTNGVGQLVVPFGPGTSTEVTILLNEGIGIPGTAWSYRAFITPVVQGRTIYVAGEFTSFDGQVRNGVARLLDNGSVDPTFDPGVGVDGPVYALGIQANNRLLIGGAFSTVQTLRRSNLARLRSNGDLDPDYHTGVGVNGPVYAITLQADGKALLGGVFTEYNFTRRVGLARVFPGGSLDTSFLDTGYNQFAGVVRTYSFEPPRYVNSIALQPDGNVMIGGSFTSLGGNFSSDHSLSNVIFFGQYSIVSGGTVFAPFTRQDKNTRYNIARLVGGYTLGPGNLEYDPNAQPFTIDENSGTFAATVRRMDGRLGGPLMPGFTSNITAQAGQDYSAANINVSFAGRYIETPISVGIVDLHYMRIPILDDSKREGDEVFALLARSISNSIVLGGEYIPLGGAAGYNDSVQVTIADNDFDHGEFNFAASNFSTNENAGTARISVIRTNGTSGAVAVDYFVLNGTATAGEDYFVTSGTLNFASGETNKTFDITLRDNPLIEPDETVILILTNAIGGANLPGGTPISIATATLTIIDNDLAAGRLNFSSAGYVTNENATFVRLAVTRTGGALGAAAVQYETFDGTAVAPGDYTATSGTIIWNSGESTTKPILIPLNNDGAVEGDETFGVRLFSPTNAALGLISTTMVTIVDADAYGILSFSEPYYETDENGGAPTISVVRRNGSSGTVTVNFSAGPGPGPDGAVPGTDFVPTNGTLTFGPGEVMRTFRVPLLNDSIQDSNRIVALQLSSPVNATLGLSAATLGLVDDESINLPAGSLDTTFSDDASVNGTVYALALQTNGSIVMAGDFTRVKASPRNRLARLFPDGTLDNSFDIGPGANDAIRTLALQSDGRLLVGGIFTTINGTNRSHIARLSTDGKVDIAFDPGSGADNPVFAIAVQNDDKVLAGGSFSLFNSTSSPGLIRLNTNGTIDTQFSVGAGFNGTVFAIGLQDDGKILVGGEFVSFNGVARTNLVRLNANGTLDNTFDPGLRIDAAVRAILVEPDGRIVIGGSFTNINGNFRRYLARLERNGLLDPFFLAFNGAGADNTVYAIEQQIDGKLIVGGDFRQFNGVTRNGITRLNDVDGSTDPTINFGNGANGFVAALLVQPDRKIVLGGSFTEYDNQPKEGIARIYGGSIDGAGSIEYGQPVFLVSESETNVVITVLRRGGTTGTVSARYSTLDNTALAGRDYLPVNDVITFPEGETRRFFFVPLLPNNSADGDRSGYLLLSDFVGAVPGPQPFASFQILDDESVLSFTTMDYSVNENTLSGNATIGVTRTGGTNTTVSVDFQTANITAVDGSDYVGTNGTLVFLPGQTFKNFNVRILDDAAIEGNELVNVRLLNQTASAALAISNATLVIVDDDFGPGQFLLSTNNYVVDEYAGTAIVTVIRTNGSSGIVSVRLQTSDGSATAGTDYFPTNRVLTFAEGETVKSIAIPIVDDAVLEPEEFFNVTLSQPTGGTLILSASAIVTILDDEFAPSFVGFSTNTFFVSETEGFATITVTRTNSRRGTLSVDFSTSDGTANGSDYIGTNGTLFFADNEGSKTFTIPVINDGISEPAETVNLRLSNVVGGSLGRSNAALAILDTPLPLQFSSATYTVNENAGTAQITVVRLGPDTSAISVQYRTLPGGSAIGGVDYIPVNGTLTWAAGDASSRTFTVPIIDNLVVNSSRTVLLTISNALGTANSVLTILDDEAQNPTAGVVDPTFNANFGANGSVRSVAYDALERLYVGGDFTQFHGLAVNRITRLSRNGAVDIGFNVGSGANGIVYSVAPTADSVYIGGAFTSVNGVTSRRIARLLPDGTIDGTFTPASGANGAVRSVAVTPIGQPIIAGEFTTYDGVSVPRVARLETNGTLDVTFNAGSGPNNIVRAAVVQPNGQVVIGGEFTSVNGFLVTRIARLNANGALDTTFNIGLGADGTVQSVALAPDGKILIAGDFLTINGVPRSHVARLNSDGSVDTSFNIGEGANGTVRAVAVERDGHILVVGGFTQFNGNPLRGVARLNSNGSLDSGFFIGSGADGQVNSIGLVNRCAPNAITVMTFDSLAPDSTAYTNYTENCLNIRGLTAGQFLAVSNGAGTAAQISSVNGSPQEITLGGRTFTLQSIYFTNVTGPVTVTSSGGGSALVTTDGLFTFGASFVGVTSVRLDVSGLATIDDVIVVPGADALSPQTFAIGGDFEKFNEVQRGGVVVLTTSGLASFAFDPRNISTRTVYASDIYTNQSQPSLVGRIVVGGDFTAIVGVDGVNRLARLNIDGTLDTSFATGLGANNTVRALAIQPDGKVVFGGFFTTFDFITRAYLARVNPDGTLDNSFNFGAGLNNAVLALALQPDGRVVIGGLFTEVYGTPRNSIARVNANGTVDTSFNVGTGANGAVKAIALQSDGKVLIGGDFTSVNGVSRFHIARLNADGTVDTSFNPGAGTDGAVNAIALTAAGEVLIGGAFNSVNGVTSPRLARLTSSGALDSSFVAGTGANDNVTSIEVQRDGRIVVGGSFTTFNGQVRNRIVRLESNGALDATINFGTGANDVVNTVTLQDYDGKIVIGGSFTEVDGLTRVAVARLFAGTNSGSGTFQFGSATISVDENAGSAVIAVLRTGGAAGPASVQYSTANGTATSPGDYTAVSGTLDFAAAETVKYITVPITDGSSTNGDRTFTVTLQNPSAGTTIGSPSTTTVTIVDNDSVIGFSAAAYSVNENAGVARISVTRSGGVSGSASVEFSTGTTGTATPGVDFTPRTTVLTFAPGVRVQTVDVPINDDNLSEFNETVSLSLGNVTGAATLGLSSATLTIVEDDASPGTITFATNSYFVSEDAIFAVIEVLRTNGYQGSVTVGYQTLPGTAIPGEDYVTTNGLITFAEGQTNAFLTVRLIDDAITEGNDTLQVQLFGPSGGATLGLANATITIADNDAPGTFVFNQAVYTVNESNAVARVTVIRTNGNQGAVSVSIQTSGGTATPTVDYTPVSTVLNFPSGVTVRTIDIPILQDTIVEGTETVGLLLSSQTGGTSIGTPGTALLQIIDDEVAVGFSSANYVVTEDLTNVVITLIRTGDTNNSFSVVASTSDASAIANSDYAGTSTTIIFAPGETNRTFTVGIIEDQLAEGNEFLNLTLSSASGGVAIGPIATAQLTILDDDMGFSFSSATYATNEGFVSLLITVNRAGFLGDTGAVDYATFDGTATAGLDYLTATGRLAFAIGQTSATFNVQIFDDLAVEGDETINLVLSNSSTNASVGPQSTAVISILDNDTTIGFSPTTYIVNEKVTNATVTLVRRGAFSQPVSVTFQTQNGTAVAGVDYGTVTTTVFWGANDIAPKTVDIPIFDDALAEGSETVNLVLSNPIGATLEPGAATGTLTIVDNAGAIAFATVNPTVVEGSGNALINLVRTGGSNGAVSVQWNIVGGTATPGQDYFGAVGTVVFAHGETSKAIILPIGEDGIAEGIETVNLVLTSAGGGARVGSPSAATLSIIDNDAGIIVGSGSALIAESFIPTNSVIEPGETVTILFALRNAGVVNADNVTASLVSSNGVFFTGSQSQNYGALFAGGNSESRPFTFTAQGTNGSRITATLMITNNGLFLGIVSFDFVIGNQNIPFQNAGAIIINDNAAASPYPATLTVSGLAGPVNHLTVTLHGVTHLFPDDLDIVLVAPNGQSVMLMSDAGGGNPNALNNTTITFDDAAPNAIPDLARITNGVYRPANYAVTSDPFPAPGPTSPYGTTLSSLNGIDPNGVWKLFIVDDSAQDAGSIAGGWSLNIAATGPVVAGSDLSATATDFPDPVAYGATFVYRVGVTNHGPAAASAITLTSILPTEANFIGVAGPGSYTQNGNVVTGNLGSLQMGEGVVVTFTMNARNENALLTFDTTVSAGQTDLNPGNNHSSIKTTVNSGAPVPALFAARKNGQLVLSWQTGSSNVVLESSSLMGSTWSNTPNVPVVSNGVSTVTVPMNGGAKYFRLRRVP